MKKKTTTRTKINQRACVFALAIAFWSAGCEPASLKKTDSPTPVAAANAAATPENSAAVFESDLETMRTANFDFIYVFRRKDGGALDGEDKKYLRANSPVATNRFILSDADRAAIAGSSFRFEPQNLERLQERFTIENFSKPVAANQNAANETEQKNANGTRNSNR